MTSHKYAKLLLDGPDLPITQDGCGPYFPPTLSKRSLLDLGEFIVVGAIPVDGDDFIFDPTLKEALEQ